MSAEAFTCPRCGITSHNPHDALAQYCGACHDWTGRKTFMAQAMYIGAPISTDMLDDYIDQWHCLPENSVEAQLPLHEFLGMTWTEYATITETPSRLKEIVYARRVAKGWVCKSCGDPACDD
jgi:hypothetical protein